MWRNTFLFEQTSLCLVYSRWSPSLSSAIDWKTSCPRPTSGGERSLAVRQTGVGCEQKTGLSTAPQLLKRSLYDRCWLSPFMCFIWAVFTTTHRPAVLHLTPSVSVSCAVVRLTQSGSDHRLPALRAPSQRLHILRRLGKSGSRDNPLGVQRKGRSVRTLLPFCSCVWLWMFVLLSDLSAIYLSSLYISCSKSLTLFTYELNAIHHLVWVF